MVDYPVNISETVTGPSESLATLGAYGEGIGETVTVSESSAVVAGFIASPGETVTGPSEGSEEPVAGFIVGPGETVTGPSESVDETAGFVASPGETVTGPSESVGLAGAYTQPIAETVPLETPAPSYSPLTESIYLQSDAQSETIQFASPLTLGTTQPFTMGVWIKRVGGAIERTVMCKCRVGGEWDWMLRVTTNAIQAARQAGSSLTNTISQSSVTWNDGNWHLLLMTYDGSGTFNVTQVLLYWDGAPAGWSGAGSQTESRVGAVGNFTVGGLQTGASTTTDHFYQANVCHSFLYDKELSAAEVSAIYGGGICQDLSAVGPVGNLVHWSALGDGDAIGVGNMIDLSTSGIDGEFVNGESGDFLADVPSGGTPTDEALLESLGIDLPLAESVTGPTEGVGTTINGGVNTLPLYGALPAGTTARDRGASVIDVGYQPAGLTTMYYRMRAWNLNTGDWELWTSEDAPSAEPPSGDPITNLSIVGQWEV